MRCSRPARSSSHNQEPQPDIQRIAFGVRTLEASLPGRGPSHSVDGVAPSPRQSASSTLKALPATPNMRRPMPTAKTTMHPAGAHSGERGLTRQQRLDNPINGAPMSTMPTRTFIFRHVWIAASLYCGCLPQGAALLQRVRHWSRAHGDTMAHCRPASSWSCSSAGWVCSRRPATTLDWQDKSLTRPLRMYGCPRWCK
jgi:hypothetical protein